MRGNGRNFRHIVMLFFIGGFVALGLRGFRSAAFRGLLGVMAVDGVACFFGVFAAACFEFSEGVAWDSCWATANGMVNTAKKRTAKILMLVSPKEELNRAL